jgi:hypothetical protein
MKIYTVYVGGYRRDVRAARAAVAVKRALDHFKDSEIEDLPIHIGTVTKVHFGYQVWADVPAVPVGSYKRAPVSEIFDKRADADREADVHVSFRNTHLDDPSALRYVRVLRVEKKS